MADALTPAENFSAPGGHSIHQVLHGYSEGHRQLESSINLSDEIARLMLRLSDLSGTDVTTGFQEYLTGYPLWTSGLYALAKTWQAPEVPRPGCVWTHTLILAPQHLEARSLSSYLRLFRRPQHRESKGEYSLAIPEPPFWNAPTPRQPLPDSLADRERLLGVFYGKANRPLVVPAKSSDQFEEIIFELWSQQWPLLRAKFSFSTGSLGARTHAGRPFDIQCVPIGLVRDVQLEMQTVRGGDPVILEQSPAEIPAWSELAADDLSSPAGSRVREFLWAAADDSSGRIDFPRLVEVFAAINQSESLDAIIATVAEKFPSVERGVKVKRLLFSECGNTSYLPGASEKDILGALGSTEHHAIFDPTSLRLRERGQALANDHAAARWLIAHLFRHPLNPLGGEILVGLIGSLDPQTARAITTEQPQFLSTLLDIKPSLATSANLWTAAGNRKRELFASLERQSGLEPDVIHGVVIALLESRSDQFIGPAFQKWRNPAVVSALEWLARSPASISYDCRQALAHYVDEIVAWLEKLPQVSPPFIIELAKTVAHRLDRLTQRSTDIWERALDSAPNGVNEPDRQQLLALLLALGLRNAGPHPLSLIGKTFEPIYYAAYENRLVDSAWDVLEPLFDLLPWPNGWDKCERMCRGLVRSFLKHEWPPDALTECIADRDLYDRVLKSARKVSGGDVFRKKL